MGIFHETMNYALKAAEPGTPKGYKAAIKILEEHELRHWVFGGKGGNLLGYAKKFLDDMGGYQAYLRRAIGRLKKGQSDAHVEMREAIKKLDAAKETLSALMVLTKELD